MMIHKTVTTAFTLLLSGLFVSQASAAPNCAAQNATNFTGFTDDDWFKDSNWDNNAPDSTKIACIPAGKTVVIRHNGTTPRNAEALAIWIKRSGSTLGVVKLRNENTLKVFDDSQIDGKLWVTYPGAEFIVDGAVTVTGNGGLIVGGSGADPDEAIYRPLIRSVGTGGQLTLAGADNDARSTSLVVMGDFDIQAKLVNNAYVVSDNSDIVIGGQTDWKGDMLLTTNAKSGSGFWISEANPINGRGGRLVVGVAVSGSAQWILTSYADAEIVFDAAQTALSGPMTVHKGRLMINQNFTNSGDLELRSVGGSVPQVSVATGKSAGFSE